MTARHKIANATTPAKPPAKPYESTPREQAVPEKWADSFSASPSPKTAQKGDTSYISYDHPDQAVGQAMLMESIGTKETSFLIGSISQLTNAIRRGDRSSDQ